VQPATAEETAIFAKLLKLIELAPQQQTGLVAIEPDEPTKPGAPTASTASDTQAPSSASASPAPQPDRQPDPPPSAPEPPAPLQPATQSDPAPEPLSTIARCLKARNKARSEAIARSQPRYTVDEAGAKAYRNAMPPLLGAENIRDFIACVAHGMLIGVIENKDATKLLYAAQVAFSAQNRSGESRPKLKPGPKPTAEVSPSSLGNN
jgi:biopolymer transport protein ExbB